jgi:putative ATP-binding cassette transporter
MTEQRVPTLLSAARVARAIGVFATSGVGSPARWMLAALVAFLFISNGLNVVNSYVNRNFMTAITDRDHAEFARQAIFYIGVFGASTFVSVLSSFTEQRLGLLWREFVTRRYTERFLAHGTYYRLEVSQAVANPDERITDDVHSFTTTTVSFVLMLLNSSFTIVAFSGVLWSISPLLFLVAVLYAAFGSLMSILLGRPLIRLNYDQLDKEANFRSGLIHVRENAEEINVASAETRHGERLQDRITDLVTNYQRIIVVNRNLGFFTTSYNWMIQIIPALIVAPVFFAGRVEFGVITQSAIAFSTLVAAFSLIVTQIQSISSYAAVLERLTDLTAAFDRVEVEPSSGVAVREGDRLAYEHLTLRASEEAPDLVRDLSIAIRQGIPLDVRCVDEAAGLALFGATAGLIAGGEGTLIRPGTDELLLVAERPYVPPCTLRLALAPPGTGAPPSDERILSLIAEWNLGHIVARAGGLDTEQDWLALLSLAEQQTLACIRVILAAPRFLMLDRPGTALGREQARKMLARLTAAEITWVHLGRSVDPCDAAAAKLEIRKDGSWTWTGPRPPGDPPTGNHVHVDARYTV